jgi:predicted RNA-binding protein Jag
MNMMEKLSKEVNEEDFLIRVRPFADDDGRWSGEVDISIMAMPDNPMDDDDYYQVMHLAKMMCASVPVMEEVEELRNIVHEYVTKVIDTEMDIDVELEEEAGVEKTYDGNVVHLNFNTKTGGSA